MGNYSMFDVCAECKNERWQHERFGRIWSGASAISICSEFVLSTPTKPFELYAITSEEPALYKEFLNKEQAFEYGGALSFPVRFYCAETDDFGNEYWAEMFPPDDSKDISH